MNANTDIGNILFLARALAAHRNWALSTVSLRAAGKGSFLPAIDSARGYDSINVGTRRLRKIITWFSENWPEDLEWPADIPRPEPMKAKKAGRAANA